MWNLKNVFWWLIRQNIYNYICLVFAISKLVTKQSINSSLTYNLKIIDLKNVSSKKNLLLGLAGLVRALKNSKMIKLKRFGFKK